MVDFVVIVDTKRSRKAQARVEERVAAGKCCMCEKLETAGPLGVNGNCDDCRYLVRATVAKLDHQEAIKFIAELIRDGLRTRSHEVRGLKRKHIVDRKFRELRGTRG